MGHPPVIDLLLEWLKIDSTSGREAAFLEALEAHFVGLGYDARRQQVTEDRWNVMFSRPGRPTRLVYSTHVDTVPPFLDIDVRDETVFARGACDTKGGIVAMTEAGNRLLANGQEDIGYLFVVGEEVDHIGAKKAQDWDVECDRIILCEPTLNRVASAQKGMVRFEVSADGIAGHSAYPERGESAVEKLLDFTQWLRTAEWPTSDILGPTTTNIGIIEGGVAANVFAPSARAEVLMRAVSEVAPTIDALHEAAARFNVTVDVSASNDPVFYDPPEGVESHTVSFNTDATYLTKIAPVWLVGPGDIEVAHSVNEHITFASLMDGIDLYERLGKLALA